jgi:hypothetical protein
MVSADFPDGEDAGGGTPSKVMPTVLANDGASSDLDGDRPLRSVLDPDRRHGVDLLQRSCLQGGLGT